MTNFADVFSDDELGGTLFSVTRSLYRLAEGEKILWKQEQYDSYGTVHPANMAGLQLLPEEYRSEQVIVIHSPISLTTGSRIDDLTFIAPDQIHYRHRTWQVISIRDWFSHGFCKAYAVLKKGE